MDFVCVCIFFFRESRAVDMESLCVVAGKHVRSMRVDLDILDNGQTLAAITSWITVGLYLQTSSSLLRYPEIVFCLFDLTYTSEQCVYPEF